MSEKLNCKIVKVDQVNNSIIYNIKGEKIYIISNSATRKLLCCPEIVGTSIPQKLLEATIDAIHFLGDEKNISFDNINLVNILRGGLNFPIEKACFNAKINIEEISFLTSERIFLDDKVSRIESKYRKIASVPNATIVLGDIIASGETFHNVIKLITEKYVHDNNKIGKIIVFTIGTNNTFALMRKLDYELKARWSSFQGIYTIFFEAIFTTYSSHGITGLNLPNVDFVFKGGLLTLEYRKALMEKLYTIFEKCAIYDGGARRFEKNLHINTITKYWKDLCLKIDKIDIQHFYNEKLGYCSIHGFPDLTQWIKLNQYEELDSEEVYKVYINEKKHLNNIMQSDMARIAMNRYEELLYYYDL